MHRWNQPKLFYYCCLWGFSSDLPLRTIKCYSVVFGVTLRLLVIHFVVVSRHQQTSPFKATAVINSPWSVTAEYRLLHLAREQFAACDGARYWLRIAIFAYPTCIRRFRQGDLRQNIAMTFGTKKLEWCGYPTVKKILKINYSFWQNPRTWQTDAQTNRQDIY